MRRGEHRGHADRRLYDGFPAQGHRILFEAGVKDLLSSVVAPGGLTTSGLDTARQAFGGAEQIQRDVADDNEVLSGVLGVDPMPIT